MVVHCPECGRASVDRIGFCPVCGTAAPLVGCPGSPSANAVMARSSAQVAGPQVEARFTILEERGPAATFECPRCGHEFEVDAYRGRNLVIDPRKKRQLAVCPLCGTVEK